MPTVLLVRHGQASYGAEAYDVLSETGHRQAQVLAEDLSSKGVRPARIVSGSMARQRDTAQTLADAMGLDVEIDAGWNEYDSDDILAHHSSTDFRLDQRAPGSTSMSSRDFQELLDGALIAWIDAGADGPAREPWTAFDARVRAAMDRVAAGLRSGETALVVSSGGAIGGLCAALVGLPPSGLVTFNRVAINTGFARVVSGRSGLTLLSVNEHGHLDGHDPPLRTYR
jgi:broad specificity phosphatase PhoE